MRLDRVAIRNYKSIKSIELRIPQKEALRQGSADFLSIVGENNAGKSSIMEAIRLACTASVKATQEQFPGNEATLVPIEVELEFDQLTDRDRELAALTASTFSEGGQQRYRLKRIWKAPQVASENWAYTPGRPPVCQLTGWTSPKQALTLKSLRAMVMTDELWAPLLERFSKDVASTKVTLDQLIEIARELKSPLLVTQQQDEWTPYASGSAPALEAALPNVVYVPALRETTEETDVGAKASSIRKIVNSLFEQHLSNHDRVVQFKKAAAELQDLFATEGKHRIVASMEEKLTEKFKELINISAELTFSAPDVTADLASSTQFRVLDEGLSTRPDHQGHGAQRSIVLALLQLYVEQNRQSSSREHQHMLFLIEEPEIYLHPGMCRRMRDTLLRIARSGVGQVICTTHSPVFLDLADRHDGIVILRKKEGHPVATQRTQDVFAQSEEDHQQRARLRMLLNFDPAVNEAFFSEKVCLVEGDCEIAAVEAIARKLISLGEFVSQPIIYEWAWGGTDTKDPDPRKHCGDSRNPVGRGLATSNAHLINQPAHRIEYLQGNPAEQGPAGFGPIASHWSPRLELFGTFDDIWSKTRRPLLPGDYDERSALCAPRDQRTSRRLEGGEQITLYQLTPQGALSFALPRLRFRFTTYFGSMRRFHDATLGTVTIEPELRKLSMVYQTGLRVDSRETDHLDFTVITLGAD
ncbi:DUF2169 domain-containing protein [Myxococcus stipitatus]|uniref:DUF2169 domain-containing protein n=1 Tax=Myxococcus stipitatus TaxID=83455 RepID=UPI0031457043